MASLFALDYRQPGAFYDTFGYGYRLWAIYAQMDKTCPARTPGLPPAADTRQATDNLVGSYYCRRTDYPVFHGVETTTLELNDIDC